MSHDPSKKSTRILAMEIHQTELLNQDRNGHVRELFILSHSDI